jgi:hypothetical protein
MSPQLFKKYMLEAYLAGAESMICGCLPMVTKSEAREWFEENHQVFDDLDEKDGGDTEVL